MVSSLAAKGLCIPILFVETLFFGWLPIFLLHRDILARTVPSCRKLVLDLLNCLAGGVFLGVCLLHLLVEGREDFEQYKKMAGFHYDFPFYEAAAGVGVFLIALIEKVGFALLSFFKDREKKDSPFGLKNSRHSSDTHSSNNGSAYRRLLSVGRRLRDEREHAVYCSRISVASDFHEVQDYPPVSLASSRRRTSYGAVRSPTTLLEVEEKSPPQRSRPTTKRGRKASRRGRASKARATEESASETAPLLTSAVPSEQSPPTRRAEKLLSETAPLLSSAPSEQSPSGAITQTQTTGGPKTIADLSLKNLGSSGSKNEGPSSLTSSLTLSSDSARRSSSKEELSSTLTFLTVPDSRDATTAAATAAVVVDPRGSQSLTASLDLAAVVAAAAASPEGIRSLEEEEWEMVAGEVGAPGEKQQQEQQQQKAADGHHHHHTGLVASTACQPKDISQMRMMRATLLLLALSFHTVFDGLAVGLQETSAQVWGILAGIAVHKAVVSFSLGLDLAHSTPPPPPTPHPPPTTTTTTPTTPLITITLTAPTSTPTTQTTTPTTRTGLCSRFRRPLVLISLFSLITPVGVGMGMGVTDAQVDLEVQLLVSSVLQALATGIFLYVTFFEVLGQQFAHGHDESPQAHSPTATAAGPPRSTCCTSQFLRDLGKVGAAVVGFACMAGVKLL